MKKIIVLFIFIMAAQQFVYSEDSWSIETVVSGPGYVYGWGYKSDIQVDEYNRFHVLHNHLKTLAYGDLYYTFFNGTEWSSEFVDVDLTTDCMEIELDSLGNPHVAYQYGYGLRYAHRDETGWHIEDVTDYTPSHAYLTLAFELDSNDIPHIAVKLLNNHVKYTSKDENGEWFTEEVEEAGFIHGNVGFVDIAISENDTPNIVFTDIGNHIVTWGTRVDGLWDLTDIASANRLAWAVAISMNPEGNPDIIYNDWDGQGEFDIIYNVYFDGSNWINEEVININHGSRYFGELTYLIDENGRKVLGTEYTNFGTISEQWLGIKEISGTWNFESIPDPDLAGKRGAVALKTNGKPVFAYGASTWDGTSSGKPLKVANYEDFNTTNSVTFIVSDSSLEPLISLEGYGEMVATNGTATFENIPYTVFPGLIYSIELEDYQTITGVTIVDENEIIEEILVSSNDINDNYELQITNYELKQNYPNPFNPVTKISYELAVNSNQLAEIVVYNVTGQKVWSKSLSTDHSSPITDHFTFDGSKFNSGIYYYSLVLNNSVVSTKSMLLIK